MSFSFRATHFLFQFKSRRQSNPHLPAQTDSQNCGHSHIGKSRKPGAAGKARNAGAGKVVRNQRIVKNYPFHWVRYLALAQRDIYFPEVRWGVST